MVIGYLVAMCIVSAANLMLLFHISKSRYNAFHFLFFCIFISCAGHLYLGLSTNVEEAIVANKMNYLGASFLPMFMFYAVLSVCNIKLPTWISLTLSLLMFIVCGLSGTIGFSDIYYKTVEYVNINGIGNYSATYGIGHDFFNLTLLVYIIANISVTVYSFIRKKGVSFKNLIALSIVEIATILSFFLARLMENDSLIMPGIYVFNQFVLLYIYVHVNRYNISLNILKSLEDHNTDAYLSISSNNLFLGANDIAYSYFPTLKEYRVDHAFQGEDKITKFFLEWIDEYSAGNISSEKLIEVGDTQYKCTVKVVKLEFRGYLFLFKIEDNTKLYRYVKMLGKDNVQLQSIVKDNANQIHAIQEQMIVGMANMVESRDSNTGGHIKRTSRVVSILVSELRKDPTFDYSDEFYNALIKSAPMHDLGKIAIDDQILRKPGRFTPDEYEVMKTHPEKGAVIVDNLLAQIEDPKFVQIARNVACFHHERFDGKGYPKGLQGENIPFEARVMAIADVYDALVSKRCYKDAFTPEKAFETIAEGMGSQFDASLWKCFYNSRKKLEEYYLSETAQS